MAMNTVSLTNTVIGSGRSSTVYLGRLLMEQASERGGNMREGLVAVKLLERDWCHEHRERVILEAAHHMSLSVFRHPFIARMLGVELDRSGLALLMEYKQPVQTLDKLQQANGGRLHQSVARQLFAQLMIALEFCHRLGLSNRDCKITDLLVHVDPANGDVKLQLTDFSFAKDHEQDFDSNTAAQHGSALFAAPEVITGSPTARYSGCKADVWSAGVVLCTLVFGCHPHLAPDQLQASPEDQIVNVMSNAMQGAIQVPAAEAAAHQDVFQLMAAMLSVNPAARPDASAVLAHPWVRAVLSSKPRLAVLNDGLLGDVRLREESITVRETTREQTAMLLDQMLGNGQGGRFRNDR